MNSASFAAAWNSCSAARGCLHSALALAPLSASCRSPTHHSSHQANFVASQLRRVTLLTDISVDRSSEWKQPVLQRFSKQTSAIHTHTLMRHSWFVCFSYFIILFRRRQKTHVIHVKYLLMAGGSTAPSRSVALCFCSGATIGPCVTLSISSANR